MHTEPGCCGLWWVSHTRADKPSCLGRLTAHKTTDLPLLIRTPVAWARGQGD